MTRLQNEQEKEKFISPPVRGQPSPNEQYRLLSSCVSYTANILNLISTLFTGVPLSTVIPLYCSHLITALSTVEKCNH